ncbi:MAG: heme ABC exporter ATP-binding protein CcmA [Alphaproteobacteria bacterium]|nr:heme ABC exporter ATP-binding protein CcmA [Alphaproteobacteria bacterium]
MTNVPLLLVSDFTYARGGRILFQDISFSLFSGDVIVLMGPNGSGKTTLLRCLASIPEVSANIMKSQSFSQSYVGHLNGLKMGMTVQQNLLLQSQATPKRVRQILEAKGLDALKNRFISTLSAGQRRQIALTRLALADAQVWLIDEPTTHLDKAAAKQFWHMLAAHIQGGGAGVLTSHTVVPFSQAKVITLHE